MLYEITFLITFCKTNYLKDDTLFDIRKINFGLGFFVKI